MSKAMAHKDKEGVPEMQREALIAIIDYFLQQYIVSPLTHVGWSLVKELLQLIHSHSRRKGQVMMTSSQLLGCTDGCFTCAIAGKGFSRVRSKTARPSSARSSHMASVLSTRVRLLLEVMP